MADAGVETLRGVDILSCDTEKLVDLTFVELLLRLVASGFFRMIHMGTVCTTFSIAAKPAYRFRDEHGTTRTFGNLPGYKIEKVAMGDWFVRLSIHIFDLQIKNGNFGLVEWCSRMMALRIVIMGFTGCRFLFL